jgi:hypothetical protein
MRVPLVEALQVATFDMSLLLIATSGELPLAALRAAVPKHLYLFQ